MYRKCLLAAAIGSIAAQGNAASWQSVFSATTTNVKSNAVTHTNQGIDGIVDTTGVATTSNLLVLGSEYAQNDLITFTVSQAARTNYSWPTSLKSLVNGDATYGGAGAAVNEFEVKTAATANATLATLALRVTAAGNADYADNTAFVCGDQFTVGTATTVYTVTGDHDTNCGSGNTAKNLEFLPVLAANAVVGDDIVVKKRSTVTLGLVSSTSTEAVYRVSSILTAADTATIGSTTIGAMVQSPAVEVTAAGLVAAGTTGVTMSSSAKTGAGTAMDANGTAYAIAKSTDQFPLTITKFNGIVDVEQSSAAFTGGNSTASQDCVDFNTTAVAAGTEGNSLTLSAAGALTLDVAVNDLVATSTATTHTVNYTGGFSWLDTTPATAGLQGADFTTGSDGGLATAADTAMTKLTVTDATTIETGSTPLCINKSVATQTIPTGTFDGNTVYTWTNAAGTTGRTSTTTHASLGAWTLNGVSLVVYGVPMGSTVDRMIWVNNAGSTDAVLTGSFTMAGVTTSNLALGTANALTSTSIDEALDTALTAAGVTPADSSRGSLTISAPVKTADVTVSASYRVKSANDRLGIETSDSIDGTAK
jgi:hypothetical protein